MKFTQPLDKFLTQDPFNPEPVPTGRKFAETFGDGVLLDFPIEHNLGNEDVIVQVREANDPQDVVTCDIRILDENNILLSGFESTPASGSKRVVVL